MILFTWMWWGIIQIITGLTNGRLARIIRPIYFKSTKYPDLIILDVEGWNGQTIFGGLPVKVQLIQKTKQKQFPIRQAIAQTLHKNQVNANKLSSLLKH